MSRQIEQISNLSNTEKVGKVTRTINFKTVLYKASTLLGARYIVEVSTGNVNRYSSKKLKLKSEAEKIFDKKRDLVIQILEGTKILKDLK